MTIENSQTDEAKTDIAQLFSHLGVKRVVFVDDNVPQILGIEEVIALCITLGVEIAQHASGLEDIPFDNSDDAWQDSLRELWTSLAVSRKREIARQLNDFISVPVVPQIAVDQVSAEDQYPALGYLFSDHEFIALRPEDWLEQQVTLLDQSQDTTTIFLFDRVLNNGSDLGEDGGLTLIKNVIDSERGKNALCGLISHSFSQDEAVDEWKKLSEQSQIPLDKFILISKRDLISKPMEFVYMLKLTILHKPLNDLVNKFQNVIEETYKEASKKIRSLNIYTLDHIIFRSSFSEGVWEPDTLFRLFGIFHRAETLKKAKDELEITQLSNKIRSVSRIALGLRVPEQESWRVQKLEMYDDADYINKYHLPIELGDIFQRTVESNKQYMLLAQPCDLMVRTEDREGERAVDEALLVEIVKEPADKRLDNLQYFELKYFSDEPGTKYFLNFKKKSTVCLFVLDMCVYNSDGAALFSPYAESALDVIPSLQALHKNLRKFAKKTVDKYESNKAKGYAKDILSLLVPRSSLENLLKGNVDLPSKTLRYNCKRIMRLRQPYAGAALTQYAQFVSRAAFDHELGVKSPKTTTVSTDE